LVKTKRLKKKKDFNTVFKKGRGFTEKFLILRFVETKKENSRVGIIVSQKVSKKAVVRNKVKRKLRAVIKLLLPETKKIFDAVLVALPGLETKNFGEIEKTIKNLFKKAKLISNV